MSAAPAYGGRTLLVESVVDVCAFIDDLPADASGEIVLVEAGARAGAVFVHHGRVCWAAARGMEQRLSDLLAAPAGLAAGDMEAMYQACKRERVPLGEHMVGSGLVTAAELRAALFQHTSESLSALCAAPRHAEWVARRGGDYSARFTFTTPEILARAQAEANREVAARAAIELSNALSDGDWGAAYVRAPLRAAPDPIAVFGPAPDRIEPLLRLGRWAASALDVATIGHGPGAFVAALLEDVALVAWQGDVTLFAGCTSVHGPARLLNRRARARRTESSHGGL